VAQRLILVAALALAGCSNADGGDGCGLWRGDWAGRLSYAWSAPDGTSGSSDLHVTFLAAGLDSGQPQAQNLPALRAHHDLDKPGRLHQEFRSMPQRRPA